jgi:hypothetical protein
MNTSLREPSPARLRRSKNIVLKLRKELGKEIAQMVLENQAAERPMPGPRCITRERKATSSRAEQVDWKWSAATTTARPAGKGFFPLDEQLKLRDKHWSEGVARQAVKYSGKLPFAEAAEALQEIGQIDISVKSVWRLTAQKCSSSWKPEKRTILQL